MAYPASNYISPDEYLEMEKESAEKHEYYHGEVIAMAGATERHNRIVYNLITETGSFLKGKSCKGYPSDFRVATPLFDTYMYPDLSIVCGDTEMKPDSFDTLLNPSVIIEVMSPSTSDRDTGTKFWFYMQIPSLKEYILVDTRACNVKTMRKNEDGLWEMLMNEDINSSITIHSIQMSLSLKDIYYLTPFTQNTNNNIQ